jgi:Tfp pilus assembly protein PilN
MFVGSSVAAIGGFGYFWLQADGISQEKTKLEAQLAKNAPLVKQIEEYQKQYNEVSPRLKTLEDAQLVSNRWGRIMTHIAHQTPAPTWLTAMRVTSNEPSKPIGLSLVGVAPGQAPISEFILRLQNSKDLENVTLKYSQEKMMQLTKMVEFEVTADIVDTAEAKPKQEGESK